MPFHLKLDQFEGPLPALLQMIQDEKLKISEVSLSSVADQYLSQLRAQEGDFKPDTLADFLVVASKLLLLKVRQLLPLLSPQEEDEALSLVEQLKLYEAFAEKSAYLAAHVARREFMYGGAERVVLERSFRSANNLTLLNLAVTWRDLLHFQQERLAANLPEVKVQKVITLQECLMRLEELIKKQDQIKFSRMLGAKQDPVEIIVHFLAVLELLKRKVVSVKQDGQFEEIHLSKF